MPIPANFKGGRLHKRHAWTIPIKLSFAPVALVALIIAAPIIWAYPSVLLNPLPLAQYLWESMTPWPFAIAAFFSLIAWLSGVSFGSTGRQYLSSQLDVRELGPEEALSLRVYKIADALQLPRPRVAIMSTANAYAIGSNRKDAAVVIGRPLIQHLTEAELDAVIGHELGHIVSGDMQRMQMAAGYQSIVQGMLDKMVAWLTDEMKKPHKHGMAFVAAWIAGQVFRGIALLLSEIAVKSLSRSREYIADAFGALASTPEAMIGALAKLHGLDPPQPRLSKAHQNLMFWNSAQSFFSTHPTYDKRVAALQSGKTLDGLIKRGSGHRRTDHDVVVGAPRSLAAKAKRKDADVFNDKPADPLFPRPRKPKSDGRTEGEDFYNEWSRPTGVSSNARWDPSLYEALGAEDGQPPYPGPSRRRKPTPRKRKEDREEDEFRNMLIDCASPAFVILAGVASFVIVFSSM